MAGFGYASRLHVLAATTLTIIATTYYIQCRDGTHLFEVTREHKDNASIQISMPLGVDNSTTFQGGLPNQHVQTGLPNQHDQMSRQDYQISMHLGVGLRKDWIGYQRVGPASIRRDKNITCWVFSFGGRTGGVIRSWADLSELSLGKSEGVPSPLLPPSCMLRFVLVDTEPPDDAQQWKTPEVEKALGGRYNVIQFMPKALVGEDRTVSFFDDVKNNNKMAGSMFETESTAQVSRTVEGWSIRSFFKKVGVQRNDYVHLWFNCEGAEFEAISAAMKDRLICSVVDSMSVFLHYKTFRGARVTPFRLWAPEDLLRATVEDPSCRTASLFMGPGKLLNKDKSIVHGSKEQYPDSPW